MTPSIVSIGVFDGVHLGHRAILRRAREAADARGARVVAVSFSRHPQSVLRSGSEPPRLLPVDVKDTRLRAAGADEVVVLDPTPELLGQTAEAFIHNLVREHGTVAVVEGEDFRFGKGRRGDGALLRELGEAYGFETHIVPKEEVALSDRWVRPVSSSLVRWLVGHGRVADAAVCLAAPFALTATVVKGDQRGRTIGIPTANLDPLELADFIIPADGVYAGLARVPHREGVAVYAAAVSVGLKPTFRGRELTVEAHLLGFRPEPFEALYGRRVTVEFHHWLRDQYAYPGLDPLLAQLRRDLDLTRRLIEPLAA